MPYSIRMNAVPKTPTRRNPPRKQDLLPAKVFNVTAGVKSFTADKPADNTRSGLVANEGLLAKAGGSLRNFFQSGAKPIADRILNRLPLRGTMENGFKNINNEVDRMAKNKNVRILFKAGYAGMKDDNDALVKLLDENDSNDPNAPKINGDKICKASANPAVIKICTEASDKMIVASQYKNTLRKLHQETTNGLIRHYAQGKFKPDMNEFKLDGAADSQRVKFIEEFSNKFTQQNADNELSRSRYVTIDACIWGFMGAVGIGGIGVYGHKFSAVSQGTSYKPFAGAKWLIVGAIFGASAGAGFGHKEYNHSQSYEGFDSDLERDIKGIKKARDEQLVALSSE